MTTFYNGTAYEVVDSRSYHRDDGIPLTYVYTLRHTIPSLKDTQHMRDDVTVQITVVDGIVTEQMFSMGANATVGSI